MAEKIAKGLYRIGVPLPGNPLRELNSYLFQGEERDLLVDTGFRCEACEQALMEGLRELGANLDRLDVVNTHLHSDHSGLDLHFAGQKRHIYMSAKDMETLRANLSGKDFALRYQRYIEEGFPENLLQSIDKENPSVQYMLEKIDQRFCPLEAGDVLTVGDYTLQILSMPGHSPGSVMLWAASQGIMLTGDHILFDISPNITAWVGVEDSLGDYLESLKKAAQYPVTLALPGHRSSGDYHRRIAELQKHHQRRLAEISQALEQEGPMTAYEITSHMHWKIRARNWAEFPPVQKWFAVGECMAHLDYLTLRGVLTREMVGNRWEYNIKR